MIDDKAKKLQRKPRKGDRIGFGTFAQRPHPDPEVFAATGLHVSYVVEPTAARFTVARTPDGEENLCWIREDGAAEAHPFIWRHPEGPNLLARIFADGKIAPDISDRLLACCFPTGISYCDKGREENGDYVRIAFLPFRTLVLEWSPGNHPAELRALVEEDAARMEARRGQEYQVDMCGHTVVLGGK